jgi:hypothetical protein
MEHAEISRSIKVLARQKRIELSGTTNLKRCTHETFMEPAVSGPRLIVQYGNQATSVVPPKYQSVLALAVGLAQAAVAWKAHTTNPDGTPASTAYVKK